MKIKEYSFDNGKYKIRVADDGSMIKAYRYDEFWQNLIGDNLTASMLNRIDELEQQVSNTVWEASARHAQATGGWQ